MVAIKKELEQLFTYGALTLPAMIPRKVEKHISYISFSQEHDFLESEVNRRTLSAFFVQRTS